MTITELVAKAHKNAIEHGFWNPAPALGTSIALIHSELSEALEEARKGSALAYVIEDAPKGVAFELADAIIRIADLCGHLKINLEAVLTSKMAYNERRPYKHGKQF